MASPPHGRGTTTNGQFLSCKPLFSRGNTATQVTLLTFGSCTTTVFRARKTPTPRRVKTGRSRRAPIAMIGFPRHAGDCMRAGDTSRAEREPRLHLSGDPRRQPDGELP